MSLRASLPVQLIRRAAKVLKIRKRERMAELHRLSPVSDEAVDTSKPMRLILHAGAHKSGSTSIQAALVSRYGKLLSEGVLYPSGIFPDRQHSLITGLITRGSDDDIYDFFLSLRHLANRNRCDKVVLSGEAISLLKAAQLEKLRSVLDACNFDVRVVLFTRPEVSLLRSSASQWMVSYPRRYVTPYTLFKARRSYSVDAILRRFRDTFGAERLVHHELAPGDNAVEIFARLAGVDLPVSHRRNASPDFAVMSFINAIKADFELAPVAIHSAAEYAFGSHRMRFTNEERFLDELLHHMQGQSCGDMEQLKTGEARPPLSLEEQVAYLRQFEKFVRRLRKDHAWSLRGWVGGRDERRKRALARFLKSDAPKPSQAPEQRNPTHAAKRL